MSEEENSITSLEDGIALLEEGPRRVFDLNTHLFEQVVSTIKSTKVANRLMDTTPENVGDYREKCDIMIEQFRRNIEDFDQLRAVFFVDDTDTEVDQRLVDYYGSNGIRVFRSKIDQDKYTERLRSSLEQKVGDRDNIPVFELLEHGMEDLCNLFDDPGNDIWILEELTSMPNM